MSYGEYFKFLDDNMFNVIVISIIALIFYFIIYRKYILSLFDPLVLIIIATALANATIFYLYFDDQIKSYYFYSFIITEISFLVGFFIISPLNPKPELDGGVQPNKWYDSTLFISTLFYWSSIIHIAFQFLTYSFVGLPILMDSRLTTYLGGSGFGIVGRIVEVAGSMGTVLLFYRLFYGKYIGFDKFYNYVYLILVIFFLIVSGNKTNVIFLVYYLFLLQISMNRIIGKKAELVSKKISKTQLSLFIISIPLIFVVISVQFMNIGGSSDELDAGAILLFRLLSYGDVYYMALPHNVIERMNHDSAFLQLFKDILGTFRFVSWEKLPMDCGIEISTYHSLKESAISTGPNPRYNYFAILYFGLWGQIFYCFIVGIVTSFVRNTLYNLFPKRIIFSLIYILLNFNLIYMFQDQAYFIGHNFNILLFFPLLLLLSTATYLILINWNKLIQKTESLNA